MSESQKPKRTWKKKERHSTRPDAVAARKEAWLKAYKERNCVASRACDAIGIEWVTYWYWLQNDPDFRAKKEALDTEYNVRWVSEARDAALKIIRGEYRYTINGEEYIVRPDPRIIMEAINKLGKYIGIQNESLQPIENAEFLEFLNEKPNEKLERHEDDAESQS